MTISPSFAIDASDSEIEALASDDRVLTIELDKIGDLQLVESVPLIGMNAAHTSGATGGGWAVAVPHTGVDTSNTFTTPARLSASDDIGLAFRCKDFSGRRILELGK